MTVSSARRHEALAYDILTPDAPRARQRPQRAPETIVDAEFVTLRDTVQPSRAGNDNRTVEPVRVDFMAAVRGLMESVETRLTSLSVDMFSALVAALFVVVFVLAGGLSSLFPQEASPAPAQPLVITHASLTPQEANGMRLLTINGVIENHGQAAMAVPPVRASLMSGENLVASIVIDPPVALVQPGHSHGFVARVVHPGGKMPELKLSFSPQDVPGT
ncbi:MAG: hypothetical protein DI589_20475 [Shinella sp.]|nr:MAG: hypothetical protein DI589_20475 [Shinella sp.]